MQNRPGDAFRCGPLALDRIRNSQNPTAGLAQKGHGVSLASLRADNLSESIACAIQQAGQKTVTLKGDALAEEFQEIVADYVRATYGGEPPAAHLKPQQKSIGIRPLRESPDRLSPSRSDRGGE